MIRAFAFDAYGTLFDVHSVTDACDRLFPGHGTALSRLWRAKQIEYTWLLTLMGRYEDFWEVTRKALAYACRALSLAGEVAARERLAAEYLHLAAFPEVGDALRDLARRVPLAILSNGSPRMLESVVAAAHIGDALAHVLSADAVRVYKPSPLVYQQAVDALGVEAGSIGFVSANPWDVQGAKAFGLRTFSLNRSGLPIEELGFPPDATVASLSDLVDQV